ncbi:SEC63 [Lepeophtheirus salmonis]|uniref:SEC63 n=1 Tax=Lepeophtheirus salmonis TaxID=72036 RepID=A0A7R8H262_LEPSM|nr:SEC63 [Lepeophtheirus salmonis]CAF2807816.1 SEC63 [Lepeophtheirus salmonis]
MKDDDRRNLLRSLTDEQYKDVLRVLATMPLISIDVTTEVVDDEEHMRSMETLMTGTSIFQRGIRLKKRKRLLFGRNLKRKNHRKKPGASSKGKSKPKPKASSSTNAESNQNATESGSNVQDKASDKLIKVCDKSSPYVKSKNRRKKGGDGSEGSEAESGSESDFNEDQDKGAQSNADNEDDEEAEWERFQSKMNKREKALESKSRVSHSVHCPYFPDDKQEYWWCYISERKTRTLMTPPNLMTSLVDSEFVKLVLNAPPKPGPYNFTVCLLLRCFIYNHENEEIPRDISFERETPLALFFYNNEDDTEQNYYFLPLSRSSLLLS